MNLIEIVKFIRDAKEHHFISVEKKSWDKWSLIIRFLVWRNKNYVPCVIYRRKYKFLSDIVVIGLKWNGKNVKRRTSGIAKEFVEKNRDAKCIYCERTLTTENATTDHIVPISEGGNNTRVNLVVTCFDCNNERGNLPFYKYLRIKNDKYRNRQNVWF